MKKAIVDLAIALALFATASADARSGWQTFDDCRLVANAANDGDSFHVTCKGKQYLFRLYFVDTAETDESLGERIDEQAKYFGIAPKQTIEVGKIGAQFTRDKLTGKFTVRTCFQDALGRSKMERFYAIVQTPSGDLGEQLIENGLARIHGTSANPIGLPRADVEWQKLQQLEREAKLEKVGAWGVKEGRMLVRSVKSKNRAGVDPFDAFFHPERVAATSYAPKPRNDFDQFFHPAAPTPSALPTKATSSGSVALSANKIDINTATWEQLDAIPGIGEALAQRIIAARPFKSADDLQKVRGIGGGKKYERIRPYFN